MVAMALLGINGLAYSQAYSITHFTNGVVRTKPPAKLTIFEKIRILLLGVRIPKPANQKNPTYYGLDYTELSIEVEDDVTLDAWLIRKKNPKGIAILFHGYAASMESNLTRAVLFRDIGYDTLLVDFRGSGRSTKSYTSLGYAESRDVQATIRYVHEKLDMRKIVLFGQSLGAVAIMTALQDQSTQVQSIILECPFDKLISTTKNRFYAMRIPSFPFAELLVFWGSIIHGYNGFDHNPSSYALKIKVPTLLLHGATDARVRVKEAKSIFANLAGEKSFYLFRDSGHNIDVIKFEKEWKTIVARFLREAEV